MPPKNANWSVEQIAFVMDRSAAGIKPAKIGEAVKERWPDKEVAKSAISGLIARQNKKKTTTQGRGQSSRDSSLAPSISGRSETGEPSFAPPASIESEDKESSNIIPGSPSVLETPQPPTRPTTPLQKIVKPTASPKIAPFSSLKTPPPRFVSFPASNCDEENLVGSESSRRSHKKNDSNVSAPRKLPSPSHDFHKETRRPSAAQFLERMVSLSPGEGGSGSNFLRVSQSPEKSHPSPELPVLSMDSVAASGFMNDFNPSLFSHNSGSSANFPAINAPNSLSKDPVERFNSFSGSDSHGATAPLYSPQPRPATTEPFPAFDNQTADRLLKNITPVPSPTYFDPELPVSSFESDKLVSRATFAKQVVGDESEAVKNDMFSDAEEVVVAGKTETDVELAAPAQENKTDDKVNEVNKAETEVLVPLLETQFAKESVHIAQQPHSSPVRSPELTLPELDIISHPSQVHILTPGNSSPVHPPKPLQPAIWSPPEPVKMLTLSSTLGSEIVHFYVGTKRKEFIIHGNPLRLKSNYFKDFRFIVHADTGKTEHYLADADANALEFIIDWVYRQGIQVIPSTLPSGSLEHGTDEYAVFTKAVSRGIEVYMLATKFGMPDLQDLIMTELGKAYYTHQTFPSSADIVAVYANKDSESPLRRYMARSYQILADLDDGQVETAGWTAEAVDDIVSQVPALFKDYRALNRKSKGLKANELSLDPICSYHAHQGDEECVSKGMNFRGLTT